MSGEEEDRTLVLTNAPAAYDYGYTRQVGIVELLGRWFRLVEITGNHVLYQCERYRVGPVRGRRGAVVRARFELGMLLPIRDPDLDEFNGRLDRLTVAERLRSLAARIEAGTDTEGAILDMNGNRIGHWSLVVG